jgi:hypothetical protein
MQKKETSRKQGPKVQSNEGKKKGKEKEKEKMLRHKNDDTYVLL